MTMENWPVRKRIVVAYRLLSVGTNLLQSDELKQRNAGDMATQLAMHECGTP